MASGCGTPGHFGYFHLEVPGFLVSLGSHSDLSAAGRKYYHKGSTTYEGTWKKDMQAMGPNKRDTGHEVAKGQPRLSLRMAMEWKPGRRAPATRWTGLRKSFRLQKELAGSPSTARAPLQHNCDMFPV